AEGLTPDQALRKNDIERVGATPTRGRVSGNLDEFTFENRVAGRAMENPSDAARELQDVVSGNKQAVLQEADRLASSLSADRSVEGAGFAAREALTTAKQRTQREVVTPAFEKADENLAQFAENVRISADEMATALQDEMDNIQDPGMAPVRSVLKDF